MAGVGGVGDSSMKPINPPMQKVTPNWINAKVKWSGSLADLKKTFESVMGKKKGDEFYSKLLGSMMEMAMMATSQAAKGAQRAAKQMRQQQG